MFDEKDENLYRRITAARHGSPHAGPQKAEHYPKNQSVRKPFSAFIFD
jgi:hypothetical protein